jgi:regulator of RNase E activity RraA
MPDPVELDKAWTKLRSLAETQEGLTCSLADAMARTNAMNAAIQPMWAGARCVGPAITAAPAETDLTAVFDAIDIAGPGGVIVVQGFGSPSTAFWGENTTLSARNQGVAGVVIDAPCRDVAAHFRLNFPVFATGATPRAGILGGRGETQIPVSVGGLVVQPGDAVVGDENGVVVVPASRLVDVVAVLEDVLARERETQEALASGGTIGMLRKGNAIP